MANMDIGFGLVWITMGLVGYGQLGHWIYYGLVYRQHVHWSGMANMDIWLVWFDHIIVNIRSPIFRHV